MDGRMLPYADLAAREELVNQISLLLRGRKFHRLIEVFSRSPSLGCAAMQAKLAKVCLYLIHDEQAEKDPKLLRHAEQIATFFPGSTAVKVNHDFAMLLNEAQIDDLVIIHFPAEDAREITVASLYECVRRLIKRNVPMIILGDAEHFYLLSQLSRKQHELTHFTCLAPRAGGGDYLEHFFISRRMLLPFQLLPPGIICYESMFGSKLKLDQMASDSLITLLKERRSGGSKDSTIICPRMAPFLIAGLGFGIFTASKIMFNSPEIPPPLREGMNYDR